MKDKERKTSEHNKASEPQSRQSRKSMKVRDSEIMPDNAIKTYF